MPLPFWEIALAIHNNGDTAKVNFYCGQQDLAAGGFTCATTAGNWPLQFKYGVMRISANASKSR